MAGTNAQASPKETRHVHWEGDLPGVPWCGHQLIDCFAIALALGQNPKHYHFKQGTCGHLLKCLSKQRIAYDKTRRAITMSEHFSYIVHAACLSVGRWLNYHLTASCFMCLLLCCMCLLQDAMPRKFRLSRFHKIYSVPEASLHTYCWSHASPGVHICSNSRDWEWRLCQWGRVCWVSVLCGFFSSSHHSFHLCAVH